MTLTAKPRRADSLTLDSGIESVGVRAAPHQHQTARVRADLQPVAVFDNFWSTTLSFMSSLGRRRVPLHVYGSAAARWSRYRTRRESCPCVEDADRFLPWLERRVRSGEICRVAPTSDTIVYYLSLLRGYFAPEVRRTIATVDEVSDCLVKTRFTSACERIGQPVPRSAMPEDLPGALVAAQELGFPLVMKPRSHLAVGSKERGRIVPDLETLRRVFRPYAIAPGSEGIAARHPGIVWPMLQQYIATARMRVYSISGIKDAQGGIIVASLSAKLHQWPPDMGISTSQITCDDERILSAGLKAVDQLISRGIFELELLDSGADLLAIDLNPRAFGFLALDMALGNDLPWLWYQSTMRPLTALPQAANRPVVASRLRIPYLISRCVGALCRQNPAQARTEQSNPVHTLSMLGHWNDPLPKIISQARMLRHPGGLIRPYLKAARRRDGHGPVSRATPTPATQLHEQPQAASDSY